MKELLAPIEARLNENRAIIEAASHGVIDPVVFADSQDHFATSIEAQLDAVRARAEAPPRPTEWLQLGPIAGSPLLEVRLRDSFPGVRTRPRDLPPQGGVS